MAYIVITINFVKKLLLENYYLTILFYIIFNFISKFEMYMEVKLNRAYMTEKKYIEMLKTTKTY